MLKVLFIDDEPIIREGLCSIIDWKEHGYRIIGTAKNGKEGLQYIQKLKPDVVFVDIKMPGLSGIEMVAQAKQMGSSARFVVLSGYSDFTYAQELIRLGIESYLLKPVDEEELIPLIVNLKMKCLIDRKIDTQLGQYEKIKEYQEWKDILHGNMERVEQTLRISYENEPIIMASFDSLLFDDWEIVQYKIDQSDFIETKIITLENQMCILFITDNIDAALTSLKVMKKTITNHVGVEIKAQFIDRTITLNKLPFGFEQLQLLQNYSYCFDDKTIVKESLIKKPVNKYILSEKLASMICRTLEFEDYHQLDLYFTEIQTYYQTNMLKKEKIRADWLDFIKLIISKLKKNHPEISLPANETLVEMIYQSVSLEALLKMTKQELLKLSSTVNGFVCTSGNTIERITQYVEQYHYKDLSLKVIAELFKYNRSYIGKKFKQSTGDYFHVYLDKVRLEKAKELLKIPDMKVYQVSEKVGYSNNDYFYKKFKKYTGVSPKEYQKQQLNKELTV
ncbi:response regulator [Gracilibacillus oryzae]|uniref:Response regulator n=1 Tax=Gracilibacillus oryzae TaxID=1672701 RepID=A0A7C8KP96_9BACI|nr:response regulator [Gracilibacillus oryzae]KAB8130996.1 response regulator [Gracilibacillus oryzae]